MNDKVKEVLMQLTDQSSKLANRKREIPDYVQVEQAILGYDKMTVDNQAHYRHLYLLACYPELLRAENTAEDYGIDPSYLPQDISDLQALVYFIFYHNVAYLPSGERIIPLLQSQWSQQRGLEMGVITDRSRLLFPTMNLLTEMPSFYFTALMISLALFQRYDPETSEYRLLFGLLESLFTGNYSRDVDEFKKSFVQQSDCRWLVNYLPQPAKSDFSSILIQEKIKKARASLIGTMDSEARIFRKPQIAPPTESTRMKSRCSVM